MSKRDRTVSQRQDGTWAIGWSRVVLGVHYPGDVLALQLIAVVTVAFLR